MGYAVYEDRAAEDLGVRRWAGYGVPAECDVAGCDAPIDRGLAYRCESHGSYGEPDENEQEHWEERDGCGLSFCDASHLWATELHGDVKPKPDVPRWIMHQLIDPSWSEWRNSYPDDVRAQQAILAGVAA